MCSKISVFTLYHSYFATFDDCNNGLEPIVMVVYQNNSCHSSYYSSPYYVSDFRVCLPQGESYDLYNTGRKNATGTCAASSELIYKYSIPQPGPRCQSNQYPGAWRQSYAICGTTLPNAAAAPSGVPTYTPPTLDLPTVPSVAPSYPFTELTTAFPTSDSQAAPSFGPSIAPSSPSVEPTTAFPTSDSQALPSIAPSGPSLKPTTAFPTSDSQAAPSVGPSTFATYVHVTHYDYTLPSQQCEGIITSEEYIITGKY